jgi:hypothetical protein
MHNKKTNKMKKFLPEQKTIDGKMSIFQTRMTFWVIFAISFFMFNSNYLQGQDCSIEKIDCPPTFVNICADQTVNGIFGTNVSWVEPQFKLNCTTAVPGEDYSFYVEFNLPEGKNTCWLYNNVQRIGSNNLRLWQSTGTGPDVYFITPTQYFNNISGTPINMELIVGSGKNINWTLEVLDGTTVIDSQTISNISAGNHLKTITIPNTVPNGEYNLKFIFTGNGNNSCYVDRIYYNATLIDGANCAGGINFLVSSDRNPGDFFPVGSTPVIYTAVYTNSSGVTQTKTCPFDVIVDGVWGTASYINPLCAGGNGQINLTMTSANTSTNNLVYSLNNGSQIPLTGTETTNTVTVNKTTTTSITVNGTISNLPAGTYNWVVKDIVSGCEKSGSVTITQPTVIAATVVKNNDVSCFNGNDGKITVNASGGTGTLSYSIDGVNYQSSNVFSGLTIGIYSITVKDANNCTKTTNSVTINQPTALIWSCPTVDASCYNGSDGSATISFSGGTAPYTISINGGPFVPQTSPATYNNLAAGNYTKVLKDANGCIKSGTFTVKQPTQIIASVLKNNDVTCYNGNDGKLTVTANGGTGTLLYSIDGGINYQSSEIFDKLLAGTYILTVKDANNCTKTTNQVIISEPALLTCNAQQDQPVSIFGASNGVATVTAFGGNGDYTYLWDNGETTATAIALNSGSHTVTVTDSKGCETTCNVTITEPGALYCNTELINNVNCFDEANGGAKVISTGGVEPFTYLWDNGETSQTAVALLPGNHSVKVTDKNGAFTTCTVNIDYCDKLAPVISALPTPSTIDCPATPTFAQATATDDCDSDVTLTFNDVTTSGSCTGVYSITRTWTATDDCGRTSTASQTINVQDITAPVVSIINGSKTVNCITNATEPELVPKATDTCGGELNGILTSIVDSPFPISCEGSRVYTYTYTDCSGLSTTWVYTYTIEAEDFNLPANDGSTVACAADITAPVVPAVSDNCGNVLTASAPVISAAPVCEGSVTYTYTFTDC